MKKKQVSVLWFIVVIIIIIIINDNDKAKQDQYDICITRVSCKFAQVSRCWYGFVTDIMMSGRSYLIARVIATRLWLLLMFVCKKLDSDVKVKGKSASDIKRFKMVLDKKVNGIQELSRATNARLDDWCFLTQSHCRLLHVCKTSHKIVDCWFYNTRHTPQAFFHTHASIKFNNILTHHRSCEWMRCECMYYRDTVSAFLFYSSSLHRQRLQQN